MSTKIKNITVVLLAALFVFGFAAWAIAKPDTETSISERRALATLPKPTLDNVLSGKWMSDFESYTLDQFPLRDKFRTLKAITAFYALRQKDNNDIYIAGGHASKLEYPLNESSLEYAAQRFRFVYDSFLAGKDTNVYLSLVPDKNYFMAKQNGYPSIDYDELVGKMRDYMDFAKYIDIFGELELDDYYRTDAHWRQESILGAAKKLALGLGFTPTSEYKTNKSDIPFYGVYYGQSALPLPADELCYLTSDILDSCRVYDFETGQYIPVYDTEKLSGKDPYETFLSGSKSLLTIENPSCTNGKELVIFRDSFGSSMAPLLVEGYSKVTVVDIRYIQPMFLGKFIDFEGCDVLFMYSTSVLNNSDTIK